MCVTLPPAGTAGSSHSHGRDVGARWFSPVIGCGAWAVLLSIALVPSAFCQLEFTSGSRLADSTYLLHAIKDISDADVCAALDTNDRDLVDIARAAALKDFPVPSHPGRATGQLPGGRSTFPDPPTC